VLATEEPTMTQHKAQKAAIRERMAKTGERYTTARHFRLDHHLSESLPSADTPDNGRPTAPAVTLPNAPDTPETPKPSEILETPETAEAPETPAIDLGLSDAAVRRATGKGWDEWLSLLDAWGAAERTHAEIARHVHDGHNVAGWWAQGVTVGYERARGRRAVHQGTEGFAVAASKTVPVSIERLRHMLVDGAARDTWLEPGTLRLRPSRSEKSARFDVLGPGEGTRLEAFLVAKGEAKTTVQLQHVKLPAAEDVESWRAFWKERLARLATVLREDERTGH